MEPSVKIIGKKKTDMMQELSDRDLEYINIALEEKFPEETFTWQVINEKEISIRFGKNAWSPNIRQRTDNLIKLGKAIQNTPRKRLVFVSMLDIPQEVAQRSYMGTSHSPENRGLSDRSNYVAHLNQFQDDLMAKVPKEKYGDLKMEFEQYKKKYHAKIFAQLHRHASIVSPLVAGPARFKSRQMEKRNNSYDKQQREFYNWTIHTQKKIMQRLGILKPRGISADDPDAIEKIQSRIAQLEQLQDRMKKSNRIMRNSQFIKIKTGTPIC